MINPQILFKLKIQNMSNTLLEKNVHLDTTSSIKIKIIGTYGQNFRIFGHFQRSQKLKSNQNRS